jgi:photosystem II stability/assembly factor-like uncharacterized protein
MESKPPPIVNFGGRTLVRAGLQSRCRSEAKACLALMGRLKPAFRAARVSKRYATFAALAVAAIASAQSWVPQESGATVDLRGASAVNSTVAWASGAKGVFLRTTDGGVNWNFGAVPGAGDVDFRGLRALDAKTAILLSSGLGERSRIYKTIDAGENWQALRINPDPRGFWDALAMWDSMHGIVVGDPVNGRFTIYTTSDGVTWQPPDASIAVNRRGMKGPAAGSGEGAFAASNSCLFVRGVHEAWFGTGGRGGARILHTDDNGKTWTAAKTPIRGDSDSAGISSLAFSDAMHGVAVGGDYMKPAEAAGTAAWTADGGRTWTASQTSGYRSAVAWFAPSKMWIATGPSGSDVSTDGGKTWRNFDGAAYFALSFAGSSGWAMGPKGAIAKLKTE